jgi:hypothetical protein
MSTLTSIINKTDFIKTCCIGSFIFTGSAAVIACISCYITFENYRLTKETRKLIKQLFHDNNKIHKLLIFENTKNSELAIEAPKSPEIIVVVDNNKLLNDLSNDLREDTENKSNEENNNVEENVKHEKDYLYMFEEYYDIVPANIEKKGFSLYKLFGMT